MTIFLKSATCLLLLGPVFSFHSCRNEEEIREEEQASVVGIEKGVAPALWTSDSDGKIEPQELKKKDEPAPVEEVKPEVPEEIVEEREVMTREQPQIAMQPAPQITPPQQVTPQLQSTPEPKPAAPKSEEKPAPQNSGDTD